MTSPTRNGEQVGDYVFRHRRLMRGLEYQTSLAFCDVIAT
jgi:hypothetical protein